MPIVFGALTILRIYLGAHPNGSSTCFDIFDISNPIMSANSTTFSSLATYYPPDSAMGLTVNGNYLYLAAAGSGLHIIDVSNPTSITTNSFSALYNTSGSAMDVTVSGDYAYVADGGSGLEILDISDPTNPSSVATYHTSGSAIGVAVSGNYAFVASGASGLHIIDVGLSCIIDSLVLTIEAPGCMNPLACNYDSTATCDDGSCNLPGCTDSTACNYDSSAICDDGSCYSLTGCTDSTACNYNVNATCDDGSCQFTLLLPYSENFESSTGTYTNNGWIRNSGTTGGPWTGPSSGANGSNYYMYHETSNHYVMVMGQQQWIPTPLIVSLQLPCIFINTASELIFYNHMYSTSNHEMGTLNVKINGTTIWSRSGNQGNQWNQDTISLLSYMGSNIDIEFEAIHAQPSYFSSIYPNQIDGDIAIDEINIDTIPCIYGCTDITACNYDPLAICPDSSCNYPTTSSTTETACDSYTWNGTTYTSSGTYTYSTTNANNCDSTATLNLTINYLTTSSTTEIACDSLYLGS